MINKLSSSELKSAIIGVCLGDTYVDTQYSDCRLDIYVKHTYKDYAFMKFNLLKQVGNLDVKIKEKIDRRPLKSGEIRRGYRIQTQIHPYITKIKDIPLFKKPEMLNEIGLAIWYMDDGTLCIRKSNHKFAASFLAMHRYPLEFVEHCQHVFKQKFGFESKIQRCSPSRNQYLLRFNFSEALKLHKIISPYVVDSMKYKLLDQSGDSTLKSVL